MLNPSLDIHALSEEFKRNKRIQISDALLPDMAERLYYCLHQEVPWGVAYVDRDGKSQIITSEKVVKFTREDWATLNRGIQDTAADKFQFFYNSYMMVTAYLEKRDPHLILHRIVEYLNSEPFLDFIKQVTGATTVIKADAQATRYIPGSFLRKHNDMNTQNTRKIAYVINFTKDWQADWGGLLQFLDTQGHVEETYFPVFNSLTLFEVPMWHIVSYVPPSTPIPRYAITGWAMDS
ncbi:MAG TPA: 2OG-Fe(II) oxygenase family protein [Gammaproteobacteria bacterium]|jgi:Rps23 Pro-64 3,4-dihydroxylase Tpa1-like proline 4-hydroxylase|nr:2OG-Fe(II) oxygenase family protein [Gammaproteobacteria bacterium]